MREAGMLLSVDAIQLSQVSPSWKTMPPVLRFPGIVGGVVSSGPPPRSSRSRYCALTHDHTFTVEAHATSTRTSRRRARPLTRPHHRQYRPCQPGSMHPAEQPRTRLAQHGPRPRRAAPSCRSRRPLQHTTAPRPRPARRRSISSMRIKLALAPNQRLGVTTTSSRRMPPQHSARKPQDARSARLEDDPPPRRRDQHDPTPADALAAPPGGRAPEAAEDLLEDHPRLHLRERGADAAAHATAERNPAVGGRLGGQEAVGAKGGRVRDRATDRGGSAAATGATVARRAGRGPPTVSGALSTRSDERRAAGEAAASPAPRRPRNPGLAARPGDPGATGRGPGSGSPTPARPRSSRGPREQREQLVADSRSRAPARPRRGRAAASRGCPRGREIRRLPAGAGDLGEHLGVHRRDHPLKRRVADPGPRGRASAKRTIACRPLHPVEHGAQPRGQRAEPSASPRPNTARMITSNVIVLHVPQRTLRPRAACSCRSTSTALQPRLSARFTSAT